MAKNTKIEWTTHTFNPWWGCVKVSPACKHCYAESWAKRVGQDVWGLKSERRFFGDSHWNQPLKWDAEASKLGERARVFCASMADVFEDRRDLDNYRIKLWALISRTPNLDWLLLTKRPEMVEKMAPWGIEWPKNVWLGVTVEDQRRAKERLSYLVRIPARIRFISAEPLLGPLKLDNYIQSLDWVIAGGESGSKARPSSPTWFRDLMNQCMASEVAFHFKQWGDWAPNETINLAKARVQQADDGTLMLRVGKKIAGRVLDGEIWDGIPQARTA